MPFTADGEEFFGTSEAAAMLDLHPNTLRRYTLDGTLPSVERRRRGKRSQRGFTRSWIDAAKQTLDDLALGGSR